MIMHLFRTQKPISTSFKLSLYIAYIHFSDNAIPTSSTALPGSVPSYDGIKAPAHASVSDDTVKKIKKSQIWLKE